MRPLFLTLAPLLLLAACSGGSDKDGEDTATPAGDDDDDTTGDDDDDTTTTPVALDTYTCDPKLHPLTTTVLDTSGTDWVYYDVDAGVVVGDSEAGWDLRFSTWFVETNGGATGSDGVEVGFFAGYYDAFDDHCQAPGEGMAEDSVAGEGFGAWYDYDYGTHELSPHDAIYYVKTGEGAYHRMIWDGYYEGKGAAVHTPGFRHGPVEPPL